MSIILNGTTGITTPDLTSTDDITANSATVLTNASSIPAANLTGSLPAIDGSALTGIAGGVTSLNGETGAITNTGTNAIGSYFAGGTTERYNYYNSTTQYNPGGTVAGSSLLNNTLSRSTAFDQHASPTVASAGFSGTWRVMSASRARNDAQNNVSAPYLFVRIS